MRFWLALLCLVMLGSCGPSNGGGPINVAVIGAPDSLFQQGVRLSPAAQHLRSATFEGLVTLDPAGQVVPALAERWIVTDDGLSYIFRLRDGTWPGGDEITATDVRRLLQDSIARLRGTSLGLDLAKISEIRAMTGRVVEVRLTGPMPDFLRLLAQPELGFVKSGSGAGPMVMSREDGAMAARLSALPPEARGLPAREDWEELARPLRIEAMSARKAVETFSRGDVDLVLGGSIVDFPLAEAGPLSRGTIQVDPALGLMGLVIREERGLLADSARREALLALEKTPRFRAAHRLLLDVVAERDRRNAPPLKEETKP
jgi:ABC-type oligopeptide transport system substrate-binding subunit